MLNLCVNDVKANLYIIVNRGRHSSTVGMRMKRHNL